MLYQLFLLFSYILNNKIVLFGKESKFTFNDLIDSENIGNRFMGIGHALLCICFEGYSIIFITSCPKVFVLSPNMEGLENMEMNTVEFAQVVDVIAWEEIQRRNFGANKEKLCCFWDKEILGGMSCFLLEIRLLMPKKCLSVIIIRRNYLAFFMHLLAFVSDGWNLRFTWFLLFLTFNSKFW